MKTAYWAIAFAVMIVCLSALASAKLSFSNVSVASSYGPSQPLEGSLGLMLDGDSANMLLNAIFEDGIRLNRSMTLIDFLRLNNAKFTCNPSDCETVFNVSSGEKSKSLEASGFQPTEGYFALVIDKGNNTVIKSLSFNITGNSDIQSQGIAPVAIDLLNDGRIDWQYMEPGSWYTPIFNDAYDKASADFSYILDPNTPYCEKIKLFPSKRFRLGAEISLTSGTETAAMTLLISDIEKGKDNIGSCGVISNESGFVECEVNFTVPEEKEYHVCISGEGANLKGEGKKPACGHVGLEKFECADSSVDYGLYATPSLFRGFNEIAGFDSNAFADLTGDDLATYLQNYINKKYKAECPNGGCIIPVKMTSRTTVSISNLDFVFSSPNYGTKSSRLFYSADKRAAFLSMNKTKLDLSKADLRVPSSYGKYSLKLWLGGEKLSDQSITIEKVPFISSVQPQMAFALTATRFSAFAISPKNNTLSKYSWDFGDGVSIETKEPFAEHAYPSIGNFTLALTVTDSEGLASTRRFDIMTKEPKEAVNMTLKRKRGNLGILTADINKIPDWYADIVKQQIDVQKLSTDLSIFESDFTKADVDYVGLKRALDSMAIYAGIKDNVIGAALVIPSVKIDYLRALGENISEGKEEEIKSSVKAWNGNLGIKANYVIKYAVADIPENNLDLATILKVDINALEEFQNVYFILILPEGIKYSDVRINGNYSTNDLNGAIGFIFEKLKAESIEIAVPGKETGFEMFASPTVEGLTMPEIQCGNGICEKNLGESYKNCPDDCKRPITLNIMWAIAVLIALAGGLYFIWAYYAKKYDIKLQNRLFPEKSDYIKMTSFIAEELNKEKGEEEILGELQEAEWKKEQIDYALKKVLKQTKEFQRQTVINIIKHEKASGKIDSEIRDELEKGGWDEKTVGYGFKKVQKEEKMLKKIPQGAQGERKSFFDFFKIKIKKPEKPGE